jgi:molecular chaperone HtpG
MSDVTRQSFKLHLPGLLKVLAEHLYSNKQVAIRELIQNAHDSCLRRAVEGKEQHYRPRITITADGERQVLTISDNGCGLTAEEIDAYLATIGRSYTRELRERLSMLSWEEASRLIGQFGFGFLSAFLIASEVTLITRSQRPGSSALRWQSSGDEHYDLGPGEREEVGTTIELQVKPSAAFVLQPNLLVETVRKYADFLPDPIYVAGDRTPVNLMLPPWEARDPQAATLEYIARAFDLADPLCVIPLHDETVDLGHDSLSLPLSGFLFVPPSSVASVREYGDLRVFIRRMFICDDERELLPPWARFVRGVIDCPLLQPTASRESIHQDDAFEAIQQALEHQLVEGLRRMAQEDPATWRRLVRGHTDVITGWAVRDNQFFDQVADIVPFRTSRGRLTLPDYLALTGDAIYFSAEQLGSLQERLLAEGHDVPVIDASWFAVRPFLEKYAERQRDVGLVQLDGDVKKLLRPADRTPFEQLLAIYQAQGVKAQIVAFKPADLPAIVVYPPNVDFILDAHSALETDELPGPFADLVGGYLSGLRVDEQALRGTLYLNATCPLIRRLADDPPSEGALAAVLMLLHQVARLFAGRTLTPADAAQAFGAASAAIEELLR